MNQTNSLFLFRPYLKTDRDRNKLISLLQTVERKLFTKNVDIPTLFDHDIPYPLNEALKTFCEQQGLQVTNPSSLQNIITQLTKQLQELPILHLTLSLQPTNQLIEKISRWLEQETKQIMLITITVDPKILAGIQINNQGKQYDYSLKNKLTQNGLMHA
jgi:F0F1-type ATP synthase delta subunit